MRGRLHVLYPDRPREIIDLVGPMPHDKLNHLVEGAVQYVPEFDHWIDEQGKPRQVIVACNEEGPALNLPFNFPATAQWHYLLRAKGEKRQPVTLHGVVVIITGDDDFMESI